MNHLKPKDILKHWRGPQGRFPACHTGQWNHPVFEGPPRPVESKRNEACSSLLSKDLSALCLWCVVMRAVVLNRMSWDLDMLWSRQGFQAVWTAVFWREVSGSWCKGAGEGEEEEPLAGRREWVGVPATSDRTVPPGEEAGHLFTDTAWLRGRPRGL